MENAQGIRVEFTGKNLTRFGGMKIFRKFIGKLGVRDEIKEKIFLERRRSKYSIGELILGLIYAVVLDIRRQSDTIVLRLDKVFQKIVGLEGYPVQSSISRFLRLFTVRVAKAINDVNLTILKKARRNFSGWKKITLDLDSHVRTAYGHQQRATVGYNPKKPGRPSFHPLFCFIGETWDFLHGVFRSGRAYTSKGAKGFLGECLKRLPSSIEEIFLRADSGFYDKDFLDYLENKGLKYAIAVKLYPWIQNKLVGLRYEDVGDTTSVGEFLYRGMEWKKPRRMVVIREEEIEVEKHRKEPTLFELKGYTYQVIATNILDKSPLDVWRFYNGRANVENMVKEGILSYSLDVNISHFYGANVAHFYLVMLAYNLMNLFKEIVLGQRERKRMGKWIRNRFFLIAGKLVRSSRRLVLRLQEDWAYRDEYLLAEERLDALRAAA